jgi:hypothetical protein
MPGWQQRLANSKTERASSKMENNGTFDGFGKRPISESRFVGQARRFTAPILITPPSSSALSLAFFLHGHRY